MVVGPAVADTAAQVGIGVNSTHIAQWNGKKR
jgi:hypothetical protein